MEREKITAKEYFEGIGVCGDVTQLSIESIYTLMEAYACSKISEYINNDLK